MTRPINDKSVARHHLLRERLAITSEIKEQWDSLICAHILIWQEIHSFETIGIYWPIRGEVNCLPAYQKLAEKGVTLALPMITDQRTPLQFIPWLPNAPLKQGLYDIPIPIEHTRTLKPEALIIPCLGFNVDQFRLGYGGGFYDRTLSQHPRPYTLGVAYHCAQVTFHVEKHDIALDAIITEQ